MALTTGVHTAEDVLKAVMAGADITNVCSVLLENGVQKIVSWCKGSANGWESMSTSPSPR